MKQVRYMTVVLVVLLVSAGHLHAQPTKYAQAAMPFLKIDVGGRTAAMGGTYASATGSVYDMFSNPAGLAMVQGLDASTTITEWIADIRHYGGGVAYRFGNLGTFGVSFVYMDYGTFERTAPAVGSDPTDVQRRGYISEGTFSVNEYALGLSYGRQISSQFFVGGHVRYAQQDLGAVEVSDVLTGTAITVDNKINNVVFDFGTMYYTGFRDLRFGMSIRNFSNQSDYFDQRLELPLTFDFGMAMNLLSLVDTAPGGDRSQLTLALDWQHPRDFDERLHLGLEYGFMEALFVRGGYKFNYDSEGLTAGVGVKASTSGIGIKADYAYVNSNEFFGQIHRVTLGVFME